MAHADHADGLELGHYHSTDPAQLDLFGAPPMQSYDAGEVRTELTAILARARAAPRQPWPASEVAHWRTVFPQMAGRLPAEEARELRRAFAAELARLQV